MTGGCARRGLVGNLLLTASPGSKSTPKLASVCSVSLLNPARPCPNLAITHGYPPGQYRQVLSRHPALSTCLSLMLKMGLFCNASRRSQREATNGLFQKSPECAASSLGFCWNGQDSANVEPLDSPPALVAFVLSLSYCSDPRVLLHSDRLFFYYFSSVRIQKPGAVLFSQPLFSSCHNSSCGSPLLFKIYFNFFRLATLPVYLVRSCAGTRHDI